jgi:2-hydroxy-3-keto-5-methylthiopentenyl-1-phosphate phosphatase
MTRTTPVEIFCDFDGTISISDTTDVLLEKLADPQWKDIEARWEAGEIGSHECMAQQVELIDGGWKSIQHVLDSIELEPSFKPFVKWCRSAGIPLRIVSDGLDKVIYYMFAREGIKVDYIFANRLVESADGKFSLLFPYAASNNVCSSGVCKCKLLENSRHNPFKIVIGDGRSDFCWAAEADLVFAKSKLLKHCAEKKLRYVALTDFQEVANYIEENILTMPVPDRIHTIPAFDLLRAS